MRRNTIVLNQLTLDLRIEIPFAGLVCAKVGKYELCAFLSIVFIIILSNHPGTVACFVVRIIFV